MSIIAVLQRRQLIKRSLKVTELTPVSGNPKADPNTMARRQSHPIVNLAVLGSLYQGTWMHGTHTAEIGPVTAELGMKRNAIMLNSADNQRSAREVICVKITAYSKKNHAKTVCTSLREKLSLLIEKLGEHVIPLSACRCQNGGRDPPPEDECGEGNQDDNTESLVERVSRLSPFILFFCAFQIAHRAYNGCGFLFSIRVGGDGRLSLYELVLCIKTASC